jgi:4-hydroxybenzoate polyprenyltransferase
MNFTLTPYLALMRAQNPIGFFLLMWPMLWALWLANHGHPPWPLLGWMLLGCWLMRAAGCTLNDYADRDIDGLVQRTHTRPLATKVLSPSQALMTLAILLSGALIVVLQLNLLTQKLALICVLFTFIYPFSKRYCDCPQLILGCAFAQSVPMAFSASLNHIPGYAWCLMGIALIWPIAYDTIYALADAADDQKHGIRSLALWLGPYAIPVSLGMQALVLILLATLGRYLSLGHAYFVGLILASALLAYQAHLLKQPTAQNCMRAFLSNHWLGACVWLGLFLTYF